MKVLNECGEKLLKPWLSVQNVLLVFSAVYIVALIVRFNDLKSSDLAAWVQAVGAVVSIWAAWSIARQQSLRGEADAARSDLAKCAAVAGVIRNAVRTVDFEPTPGQGTIRVAELLAGLDKSIAALDRIDVVVLPDPALVAAIFEATYILQRLRIKVASEDKTVLFHNYYYFSLASVAISGLQGQVGICQVVAAGFK